MNLTDSNKVYIETYGCQMNLSDTEIVSSILRSTGYQITEKPDFADVILLNTCSVRENAEKRIQERLIHLKQYKKKNKELVVGILGCMAERLRYKLIEEQALVDLVVGPDEYRQVPALIDKSFHGEKGIAVKLSRVETYDDIEPLRTEGTSAWLSIMRGCDKFCTYCVVPFTRGRERSRPLQSIIEEVKRLDVMGFREVTLLGQNVNSYNDSDSKSDFPDLLRAVAMASPEMRIRYTTSHPQDMSDKLIETMAEFDNICKYIHLPVQSGSNRILQLMNRNYTIEHYLGRIEKIKSTMPGCSISTDIIAGFPTETEADHKATLDAMKTVMYEGAYMFKYSPRDHTKAFRMEDDVPENVKLVRLNEIIDLQNSISKELNLCEIGKIHTIQVEGPSKKNQNEWNGRTDSNKVTVFPFLEGLQSGNRISVKISRATSATLFGEVI